MDTIRRLRKKVGLTQDALAAEVGVDRKTIARWESGASQPRIGDLSVLARALQCPLEALLDAVSASGNSPETATVGGGCGADGVLLALSAWEECREALIALAPEFLADGIDEAERENMLRECGRALEALARLMEALGCAPRR